jgi:uncharacterized membrane protein
VKPPRLPAAPNRHARLDALRGVAMVWMAAFHFAFDLNHFGFLEPRQDFYRDPLWTVQRTAIVSGFLATAGASLALAVDAAQPLARFLRRWAQVVACALVVSLGSWWMFPQSFISFGVLHGIALMLLLARPLLAWPGSRSAVGEALLWGGAATALLLPWFVAHPFFDSRLTNWIGLVTQPPRTEDFVPLLPWFGVLLAGALALRRLRAFDASWLEAPAPGGAAGRALAALGRWPLTFYMLHQPVLIGALGLVPRGG